MKLSLKLTIAIFSVMSFCACKPSNPNYNVDAANPAYFSQSLNMLTDIIVHDIFSPPVASRVYVYPCIAAYEALLPAHPNQKSFAGQLNGLSPIFKPVESKGYCYPLASIIAFQQVAKQLVFSEDKMLAYEAQLFENLDTIGIPKDVKKKSEGYGKAVAQHILEWANTDNYSQTRSASKFSVTGNKGKWQPTPPAYMESIEPSWNKIRPMVLTSAAQFTPPPPPPFSLNNKSLFYKQTLQVYEAVKNAKQEEEDIARFWDCNPYVMNQTGHVMFATKKITPGGHWMGITNIACKTASANLMKTVEAHALVSIALFDAFISCWDEKYRSQLIRPETVINEHIDADWTPILQTPPFPEYTSGHSVISTAAAITLTNLFGNNFAFVDDVEVKYGLPKRNFTSFKQASEEAAISRLYGGIHYMPAITYGVEQGKKVGQLVNEKIELRK